MHPFVCYLSVFSEVRKTETCGGLIFSLFLHADKDENYDGYKVGSHFEKLLIAHTESGNIVVNDEKTAEKN